VLEKKDCYELVLHEKESLIPGALEGKEAVPDGFCNPLNILTHSFSLKRIYLVIKRRRWKESDSDLHYSNSYDLQAEGIKMTPHFAAFLKAVDRISSCHISTIARCYDLKPRTLFEWYKNDISDCYPDKASGLFAGQKVYEVDRETGEILVEQVVHIFQPGHVCESMCIDEKMIGKRYYTIFSNHQSGYIALMIESIRPVLVKEALLLFSRKILNKVKYITADMSNSMKNICEAVLPQACIIIEDAVLLDFTLDKFPLLKTAYHLCQQLRLWYQKSNIGKNTGILPAELRRWKEKVKQVNIKEFLQVARMIENHQTEIIRYFENGLTNAKAENLNGKIQRFIANNLGFRNRDFFLYRMKVYFSPAPQKKI
jgi:hypothetical protein